jgi:hypothetical protein
MYDIDGKQYLLVPASGDIPVSGVVPNSPPPANLPAGYVAFALPAK